MKRRTPDVLLVEDNDLDAEKVTRAFRTLGVRRALTRARDGLEALDTLHAELGAAPRSPRPFVLLDLNMPRMNGFEFLAALRSDGRLADTSVFVLTTSGREADVAEAYRHDVTGYFVKPQSMTDMIETLRVANGFWDLCRLPGRPA